MDPLEPAWRIPERPADGGRERGGVSAAFLAPELPQLVPASSHSLSAENRHSYDLDSWGSNSIASL